MYPKSKVIARLRLLWMLINKKSFVVYCRYCFHTERCSRYLQLDCLCCSSVCYCSLNEEVSWKFRTLVNIGSELHLEHSLTFSETKLTIKWGDGEAGGCSRDKTGDEWHPEHGVSRSIGLARTLQILGLSNIDKNKQEINFQNIFSLDLWQWFTHDMLWLLNSFIHCLISRHTIVKLPVLFTGHQLLGNKVRSTRYWKWNGPRI